jgi:hypothetical protein
LLQPVAADTLENTAMPAPQAQRIFRIALPLSLLASGCVGGQSGAEGTMNRNPGAACTVVPDDLFDFDRDQSLRALRGRHETSLAWLPIEPFASTRASSIRAVLDVETRGDFVEGRECGDPQMEIVATLELPDQKRTSKLEGRALFRKNGTFLNATSTSSFVRDLAVPGAALRGEDRKRNRLFARISDAGFSGTLTAEDEPGCESARMPAVAKGCPGESREVDWDTQFGAFALGGAVDDMEQLGAQSLSLRDGTNTDVELTLSKAEGPVCAEPFWIVSVDTVRLTAPVTVHIRSVERGIDVDIAAVISAVASKSTGLAVMFDTQLADGVTVSGSAVAPSAAFGATDAAFVRLRVDTKARPDGTSGELSVVEADRTAGWPAIEVPADASPVSATRLECIGLTEGDSMFDGFFGSPDAR